MLFTNEFKLRLSKAQTKLRAIEHPFRKQILHLLDKSGPMTVTEMFIHFRIEQAPTSLHIGILRRAKFVVPKRRGKYVFYDINRPELERVKEIVSDFCEGQSFDYSLDRLDKPILRHR